MQVKIIIGASAYAHIVEDRHSLDVKLSPGRSASDSLRSSAVEERAKARRLMALADRMERAASVLDHQHAR